MNGWPSVPLISVIDDVSGGNVKVPQSQYLIDGEVPVVDQGRALVGGYSDDLSVAFKGDLPVIVFGDHTKALKFIDFQFGMGADGVKVLRPRAGLDPRYAYHFLRTLAFPDVGYSRHFKFLKQASIPLPPLDEQRRIAQTLDQADVITAKRKESLALLDDLKQAVFRDIFGNSTSHATARLGDVASFVRGVTFRPTDVVPPGTEESVAVMRTKNVQKLLDTSDLIFIPRSLVRKADAYLESGDTLVSSANSWNLVGKCCFVPELEGPAVIGGFVTALRPNRQIVHPMFLYSWFSSVEVQTTVRSFGNRTTSISNLNLNRCREMNVPLPSRQEIDQFVSTVSKIEAHQSQVQDPYQAELIASLRKRAFDGSR